MARKKKILSPTYTELIVPTYEAIKQLGNLATNEEIYNKIIENLNLPDDVIHEPWGIGEKETTGWVVIYPATLSPTGQRCGQRLTWQRDASLQTLLGPLRRLCSAGLLTFGKGALGKIREM